MYVKTGRKNNSTRLFGLIAVVAMNGLVFWVAASGFGAAVMKEITETQVAIIEEVKKEEEPPPPPPPVEVELPPPPPQVILPDFVFERPPAPTAIQQVEQVREPVRPAEVRPPPPKNPPVKPVCNARCLDKLGELLSEYYPPQSRRNKEEGVVGLAMCVDISGKPTNVALKKSSGNDRLDEAALKMAPKIKINPAKDANGKDTAWCESLWNLDIQFKLK
jgi:protein TonB